MGQCCWTSVLLWQLYVCVFYFWICIMPWLAASEKHQTLLFSPRVATCACRLPVRGVFDLLPSLDSAKIQHRSSICTQTHTLPLSTILLPQKLDIRSACQSCFVFQRYEHILSIRHFLSPAIWKQYHTISNQTSNLLFFTDKCLLSIILLPKIFFFFFSVHTSAVINYNY